MSELDELNLTILPTSQISCGRIKEAPVAMEATYHSHYDVGNTPCTMVLLELKGIHLSQDWEHSANAAGLDPLMRLGGGEYGRLDRDSIVSRNRIIRPKG